MTTRPPVWPRFVVGRASCHVGALIVLGLAAACSDASSTKPDGDTTSAPLEIAYIRYGSDATSPDLFRMSADGRVSRRVAALPGGETMPAWSPDGRTFAFVRMQEPAAACGELWVMNTDGTGLRQLSTNAFVGACGVSWSPDGAKLAIWGLDPSFAQGIGVIAVDGTSFRWLQGTGDADSHAATWSPDGRHIAFAAFDANALRSSIRIVDADGANPRQLTSGFFAAGPSWSPDGSQIAFSLQATANDSLRIAVIDTGGTAMRYVSPGRRDWMPSWSPDGRFIVYTHALASGRGYHIYKTSVDGGSAVDLTPNDSSAHSPMWRRVTSNASQ